MGGAKMPLGDRTGRLGRGKDCDAVARADRVGRGRGLGMGRGLGLGRGRGRGFRATPAKSIN